MLFIVACLCGYMGGYRSGYKAGDNSWRYGRTYTMTYNVADLVVPTPNFDPVHKGKADFMNLLSVVRHEALDQSKDECSIRPFEPNLSLVVSASGVVHRRIHTLLTDLRNNTPGFHEEVESRSDL
jgi:hypothetical protein